MHIECNRFSPVIVSWVFILTLEHLRIWVINKQTTCYVFIVTWYVFVDTCYVFLGLILRDKLRLLVYNYNKLCQLCRLSYSMYIIMCNVIYSASLTWIVFQTTDKFTHYPYIYEHLSFILSELVHALNLVEVLWTKRLWKYKYGKCTIIYAHANTSYSSVINKCID